MASSNSGGRGVQRTAGGSRSSATKAAQWDHMEDEMRDAAAPHAADQSGNRLEDVTSRLNDLARLLAPEPEPEIEEPEADLDPRPDYEDMFADLARRSQESENRIASALEVLTNVLTQAQKAPAQPHHIEVQAARSEADFPPPPPPAPSRDDNASRFEERLARLSRKILPPREDEPIVLGAAEATEFAAVMNTASSQYVPTGAIKAPGLTFVPYVAPGKEPVAKERVVQPQLRLKDVVSEINARQRELLEDASKDNSNRVRALENRIEAIAAHMEHVSFGHRKTPNTGMSNLNNAVESLARRVNVPLSNGNSPDMLEAINRSLLDLSQRFAGNHTDMPAATLDELRGSIESLTARLDNARPGDETKAVLGTIQRSIEHLAVRLDQAVQAPSTREALVAMHGAIHGIGEQIERIGTIAGRSEKLHSLENTIEDLIAELRSAGREPAFVVPEVENLKQSISTLTRKLDSTPATPPANNEALRSMERAIVDLSGKFDRAPSAAPANSEALRNVERAIVDLSCKLDRAPSAAPASSEALRNVERAIVDLSCKLDRAPSASHANSEALRNVERAIIDLSCKLDSTPSASHANSEALRNVERAIIDLSCKLDSPPPAPPANSEALRNVERAIIDLSCKLDSIPSAPQASSDALWSVERAIVDLSSKLDAKSTAANDLGALHTIQDAIENLADRIERNGASDNAYEANIAIRSALESFVKRQELSDQRIEKLASLEGTVMRLAQLVEGSQGMSTQAAQEAASRAVREALTDLPDILGTDNARLNSLSKTLDTLQSQSEKAERRTVDAFESVRSTLERIIVRLASDEIAAGNGKAPAEPLDPTAAARAAARRAMAETQTAAPYVEPVTDMGEARSKRARFIAAARRATTPSMPEPVNDDGIDASHLSQGGGVNWKGRRVAAIGLAGLLLVLGSFQFGKLALQNDPSQTAQKAADEKQQVAAASVAAPAETLRRETSAAPKPAEELKVAAASPADPVVTGSIPGQLDLPANIGGPTLIESARRSDPAALHEIAIRYFDGDRVAQDQAKAIEWFEKSAELGFAPAQFRLGNAFDKGHGTTANPGTAEAWYRKAADQGHIKAMHNLAVLLAEGSLGKPDYSQAAYWFRRAADRGVRDSQYNLGVMLARGLGVNQDMAEAYKWFAVAANAGDADSATKRDQVAAKLKPATLVAARLEAQTWQPLPKDGLANDENAPNGGWDGPGKTS